MANDIELVATPMRERHRFANDSGDLVILSAVKGDDESGEAFSVKGSADETGPVLGMSYRFYGQWTNYTNRRTGVKEKQFAFRSFVQDGEPVTKRGVVAYLSCVEGVGEGLANRIYNAYRDESLEVCREQPERVAKDIPRVDDELAIAIQSWLVKQGELARLQADLAGLLHGRGFPKETAQRAIERWRNRAPQVIERNPYQLMNLPGIGFRKADAMYLDLGGNPARLKRQALCCAHAISTSGDGNTWSYAEVGRRAVLNSIGGTAARPDDAIRLAVRAGLIETCYSDGFHGKPDCFGDTQWLSEEHQARSERLVLHHVQRLLESKPAWPTDFENLTEDQERQIKRATRSSVGILAGSPGTGKTHTAGMTVAAIKKLCGSGGTYLAAPTGKAAVRLTEVMASLGIGLRAVTIHSLLKSDGRTFAHNRMNPLEGRFFLIDESSMVDTDLMASLLQAVPDGGHVLLIGDVNQLLPVGHGAPLRDLTNAAVPRGELTQILRNSGGIVEACAAIRDGQPFDLAENLELVSHAEEPSVAGVVSRVQQERHLDPVWDVQVLTAVNTKSDLSRRKLNTLLQRAFNDNDPTLGPFALDDKVVCTANSRLAGSIADEEHDPADDGEPRMIAVSGREIYVANGEIGRVVEIEGRRLIVELTSPRRLVRVPVGKDAGEKSDEGVKTGCSFDLAYALSVHKAQGSEFPCVVICLDPSPSAGRVGDRAWIYTAISRAKQHCVLWGKQSVASGWASRNRINERKTFLAERLKASEATNHLPVAVAGEVVS